MLLWSILQSRQSFFKPYTPLAAVTEFLLNCGAIAAAITIYSSQPLLLNALLIAPALLILLATKSPTGPRHDKPKPPKGVSSPPSQQFEPFPFKPFVTMYRGGMMVITCAAILAVDFPIFPRRFAKVENWGTSLMDMGVGSFVFSAGVVSARGILKDQLRGGRTKVGARLARSLRSAVPLLLLGVVRLWSVKGVDYAEHVSEYGVHWNFFFTLGFLPPFVEVFQALFRVIPSYAALTVLLGVAYEAMLDFTGLTEFIITAPRTNLFTQNREGIFSFFGYLAIFLAGQAAGMYVLLREPEPSKSKGALGRFLETTIGKLALWTLIWSCLYEFTTSYYGLNLAVSRRLANLPYVLWVAAFNCAQLTMCAFAEKICFPHLYKGADAATEKRRTREATSTVLYAFNRNGLAIFLLANLLTGAVNLTMPTLDMGRLESMLVIFVYMGICAGTALALDAYNVSIKL